MTVTAHQSIRPYSGATRTPTGPVRTVQTYRQPLGWQDCPASEFERLFALHEAGQINLMEMPETASDMAVAADEPEEDVTDETPVKTIADPKARLGSKQLTEAILRILSASPVPLSTQQIAERGGLKFGSVRSRVSKSELFVHVGPRNAGAWTLKARVENGA